MPDIEIVEALAKTLHRPIAEARQAAGYASESGAANSLPEPLRISDFDGFDKGDLEEIKQFLKFRKSQKQIKDDAVISQNKGNNSGV